MRILADSRFVSTSPIALIRTYREPFDRWLPDENGAGIPRFSASRGDLGSFSLFVYAPSRACVCADLKPSPASFATEAYFGVMAFRFINQQGLARHRRYRISPKAGMAHLDDAAVKAKGENYLFDELAHRIAAGPVEFDIHVQIANDNESWMTPRFIGLPIVSSFISAQSK